ncbi:MAG: EAL domain-containing protein [Pseudomonadota bacterium]
MQVLLIEDDDTDARLVEIALPRYCRDIEFDIHHERRLDDGIGFLLSSDCDVVLVDLNLPDAKGSEAVERLVETRPKVPVLVLSGNDNEDFATTIIGAGAQDFIVKGPEGLRLLPRAIKYAVQRKSAELRLQRLASFDALTGLYNRRGFEDQFEKACAHSQRNGEMVALLVVDLDKFKAANDEHGHDIGDAILREIGVRLRDLVRVGDTAARLGGDEFAVVLEGVRNGAAAQQWAERARKKLSEPMTFGAVTVSVGASIGGAMYPSHGSDAESLTKCADLALYHVKERGRNDVAFFNAQMDQKLVRKQALDSELREALSNGEIRPVYQPIVSLKTHRVLGFEVLCRWFRSDGEVIEPRELLPLARAHKLMPAVGRQLRRRALAELRAWRAEGHRHLYMSFNVDLQELASKHMATAIIEDLESMRLPGDAVRLELTDRTLADQGELAERHVRHLAAAGVAIEFDDFGGGDMSLHSLERFPVAGVKLDSDLVADVEDETQRHLVVRTLIDLAERLNITVTAKRVENRAQLQALVNMGCNAGQGFLFARGMVAAAARVWLNSQADRLGERIDNYTGTFRALSIADQFDEDDLPASLHPDARRH